MRVPWRLALGCAAVALVAGPARADDPPPPPPPIAGEAPPAAPPAGADPAVAEADRLSDQAKALYRDRRYSEAYALFEKAFATDRRAAFIYNMSKCKEKLAEYADAVTLLERYLQVHRELNGGAEAPDSADVANQIRDLKRRAFEALPEVSIQSAPPGAQVLEGGVTLGSTPLVVRMQPGRHRITLKLDKHADLDADVEVPLSGKVSVVLALKSAVRRGALAIWCNVRGAQVAVDGKVVAMTPFSGQIEVEPGDHQVAVTRSGYVARELAVAVAESTLVRLRTVLKRQSNDTTWRTYTAWPLVVAGLAAGAGGGTAAYAANKEYAGTPWFNELVGYQNLGYGVGGGALGLGVLLLAWDGLREGIPDEERVEGSVLDEGREVVPLGAPPGGR